MSMKEPEEYVKATRENSISYLTLLFLCSRLVKLISVPLLYCWGQSTGFFFFFFFLRGKTKVFLGLPRGEECQKMENLKVHNNLNVTMEICFAQRTKHSGEIPPVRSCPLCLFLCWGITSTEKEKQFFCFSDNKMLAALLNIEPEKVFAMPDRTLPDDDYKLMATLSDLADRELVATIGWAKQVPGKSFSCCLALQQLACTYP